jgi:hypothetical protein
MKKLVCKVRKNQKLRNKTGILSLNLGREQNLGMMCGREEKGRKRKMVRMKI